MAFQNATRSVQATKKVKNKLNVNPSTANEPVTFTSTDSDGTYITLATTTNPYEVEVTGVSQTDSPIVVTATGSISGVTTQFSVSVTA